MDYSKLLQSASTPKWIQETISLLAPYPYLADTLVLASSFLTGALIALVLYSLLHRYLLRLYALHCKLSVELQRYIRKMSFALVSCVPIYLTAYCAWIDGIHEWIAIATKKTMTGLFIFAVTLTLVYAIRTFGLWYKQQRNAEQRPVDGLLTVSIFFVWACGGILIFSVIADKSPFYLLSGLGAIVAGIALFFQQTLLSLIAGVQLNAERMVSIGDWIVMESNDVNGIVKEISLNTVKVRNWDRTLVCMPVRDLVSKSFVNYSHMQKGGGRRIKKSIYIDQRSVRFLSMEEVELLKKFDILKDYLESKLAEISQYNSGRTEFNTRYLTNIGTFRMYMKLYLEQNPVIRQDMPLMVRELDPDSKGIPLEFYCFTQEVTWIPFEEVQSNLMEHFLAILPNFRLRVFQECSDIYQEIGNQIDVVGGAFRFDHLKNPVYPDNRTTVKDSSGSEDV